MPILISWSANFITSGSTNKTNSLFIYYILCYKFVSLCCNINCGCLTFNLKLLENRVGKKLIHDFSNFRERQNISKCVLFSRSECSKQKFVFRFFKPSLIPVSALCSLFSVNRIDLCKWYTKFRKETYHAVLNFAYHLPKR